MFPVVTVVSGSFCVQCTCCRDWSPLIFQHRNEGGGGQLGHSCTSLVTFCMWPWFCLLIARVMYRDDEVGSTAGFQWCQVHFLFFFIRSQF